MASTAAPIATIRKTVASVASTCTHQAARVNQREARPTPEPIRRRELTTAPRDYRRGPAPGSTLEADQLLTARAAGDCDGQDGADALRVVLLLDDVGLERCRIPRLEDAVEGAVWQLDALVEAQDLARVLRLAGVVLLPVGHSDLGVRRHDDARLGAVDAGLPRAARADDLAVLVLLRILAEVPDVAVAVLRVPVVGVLDHGAVLGHDVVHDRRLDAEDRLSAACDRDLDALLVPFAAGHAVHPAAAGRHRPVRVVEPGDEVGGVECDRFAALRKRRVLAASASGDEGGEGRGSERGQRAAHGRSVVVRAVILLVRPVVVGFLADHVEALVELDFDDPSVG